MRILFVAFPFSIHTVRWMSQLSDQPWEIHLYPSMRYQPLAQTFSPIQYHSNKYNIPGYEHQRDVKVIPSNWIGHFHFKNKTLNKFLGKFIRLFRLEWNAETELINVIKKIKPDVVHTLETQHAGYLVQKIHAQVPPFKWVHSVWGIDFHYFQHVAGHKEKMIQLLNQIHCLTVEGQRDVQLAKALGYLGRTELIQSTGGIDSKKICANRNLIAPSKRRAIVVKGTQNEVRMGLFALAAIELCAEAIRPFKIYIYSATEDVKIASLVLALKYQLDIEVIGEVDQEKLLDHFANSRIGVIINKSDGVSNSMLESMLLGAFPVQSDSSCAEEYITSGKNGLLVNPYDTALIADAIRKALSDDDLVDSASKLNREIIDTKLDYREVQAKVIELYRSMSK